MTTANLYDLIHPLDPAAVEHDVIDSMREIDPAFDGEWLHRLYRNVVLLFHGLYPGYRAADAPYHDLEHTNAVFLCVGAMLYGAHCEGVAISSRGRLLALACALFHDVGLIRRLDETEGTGARFTAGHEERSIAFMARYFSEHGLLGDDIDDATHIILCTALGRQVGDIPFRSEEVRRLGQMLGSADVVAQMADRAYLEKLLLLYREFREAQLPAYHSELELLERTPEFYHTVVKRRLETELDHADAFLNAHARVRWHVDGEPFHAAIQRNLNYLERLLGDKGHYRQWLRRGGVVERLGDATEQVGR